MSLSLTVVVVGTSTTKHVTDKLVASAVAAGIDVKVVTRVGNDSVSDVVNVAVAASSTEYLSIIESEGWVSEGAGATLTAFLDSHADADIVYTDEGAPERHGRISVIAKPIFSPERLRCQFYWGDIVLYRRTLFDEIGGLDASVPGAELYDLALRASIAAGSVEHLAKPLFIRPQTGPGLGDVALDSTRRALERHLASTGGGVVRSVGADGVHDTRRLVRGEPLISIVIPSRGTYSEIDGQSRCYLIDAARSIMDLSTYKNFEITVVLDSVAEPEVIAALTTIVGAKLKIVTWNKPFNFSEKINHGVLHSRGEFVLLLNDDVQVLEPEWLESLLALAQRPGAGMSGGMLYYGDDTIQHAGHGYYEGDASHIGLDAARNDPGPLHGYRVEREVSGVTAACAMMTKALFIEVGGMSNLLPGNFNDVDLCMKVTWLGHEIYWTPHAELYHFESKTRDASVHAFEVDVAWGRWGFRMHDPRYWPYPHNRPPV